MNKIFAVAALALLNNSIYLVMINIYLIALDVNIINLGLIIFFVMLILRRKVARKTYFFLFWYNQVCITLRMVYRHYKQTYYLDELGSSTLSQQDRQFYSMIGLEESLSISTNVRLLLNFSLQLMLIIIIFKIRNEDLFKKLHEEKRKESMRSAFNTTGFKQIMHNMY